MLVFALLAVVAFNVVASSCENAVKTAMDNHDYLCGDIEGRGKCGEYFKMEEVLGGDCDRYCPTICNNGDYEEITHGCSEVYVQQCSFLMFDTKLPFDNTCVRFGRTHMFVNLMQNFVCEGGLADCEKATGNVGNGFTGSERFINHETDPKQNLDCEDGPDHNGVDDSEPGQAGTYDEGECHQLPAKPWLWVKSVECSRRKL